MMAYWLFFWSAMGYVVLSMIAECTPLGECHGFQCFNPFWLHREYSKLNWFGCFLVALVLNILCPPITIGYWIYKLCTIGGR